MAILQTRAPENFRSCRWGAERECRVSRHGSEDPHRRERNFFRLSLFFFGGLPVLVFVSGSEGSPYFYGKMV